MSFRALQPCVRALAAVRAIPTLRASARIFAPATAWSAVRSPAAPVFRSFASVAPAEISERVLKVLKGFDRIDANKVALSTHFVDDLGLDSLDVVEIVMAFEQEFGIEISDADAEKILTAQAAVDYLSKNLK